MNLLQLLAERELVFCRNHHQPAYVEKLSIATIISATSI